MKKYFPNAYTQFEISMEKIYQHEINELSGSVSGGNTDTSSQVKGSRMLEQGKTTQYEEER